MAIPSLSLFAAMIIGATLTQPQYLHCEDQIVRNATHQQQRPMRGRGPFPGSDTPGHSAGLPVRLELVIPSGAPQNDGSILIDFVITNLDEAGLTIPCSLQIVDSANNSSLSLWFTSDALPQSIELSDGQGHNLKVVAPPVIIAELDGDRDDPQTFCTLAPRESIRVHTSAPLSVGQLRPGIFAPLRLNPGSHAFTGHAELLQAVTLPSGRESKVVGTADSEPITKTLSTR